MSQGLIVSTELPPDFVDTNAQQSKTNHRHQGMAHPCNHVIRVWLTHAITREAATECRACGLSQQETFTGSSKAGSTSMCHSGFNLSSTMYKIQILFTAHRVVLLSECRGGRYLVHQILEPYTVVAATNAA